MMHCSLQILQGSMQLHGFSQMFTNLVGGLQREFYFINLLNDVHIYLFRMRKIVSLPGTSACTDHWRISINTDEINIHDICTKEIIISCMSNLGLFLFFSFFFFLPAEGEVCLRLQFNLGLDSKFGTRPFQRDHRFHSANSPFSNHMDNVFSSNGERS